MICSAPAIPDDPLDLLPDVPLEPDVPDVTPDYLDPDDLLEILMYLMHYHLILHFLMFCTDQKNPQYQLVLMIHLILHFLMIHLISDDPG
jgi:hypothetical protein